MNAPTAETNDPMLACILGLLTPLLRTAGVEGALTAVRQTVAAYKPSGSDQLVTIAQIVGFALTSLDSLRLSMQDDMATSMKLKLRGNANALTQSSQGAAATLAVQRRETNPPALDETPRQAAAPNPRPTATVSDRQWEHSWADAMTAVAAEFTAELAHLPQAERQAHLRRIGALTETARALKQRDIPRR